MAVRFAEHELDGTHHRGHDVCTIAGLIRR